MVTTTEIPTELPKIPPTDKGSAWRAWLVGTVGFISIVWAISTTSSFQKCIQQRKNDANYGALHQSSSVVRAAIVRGKLNVVCGGVFADKNDSAISAVAAAFIAIFTLALWDATRRLWKSADNQLQAFQHSMQQELNIANKQIEKMGEYVTAAQLSVLAANRAAEHAEGSASALRESADTSAAMLKSMADTAERQLRAYVLVGAAQVENIGVGLEPKTKVTIQNFGQTPAYELRQWSNMGFDLFPPTIDPPMEDRADPMATHPLGPGAKLYAFPILKRRMRQCEIDGLIKGEVALYIIGKITYKDAFGQERVTEYRLFCGGPIGIEDGKTAATEMGNTAT